MALDFIASADGTKLPTRTRTDGAPASGTVEVPEGVTDILDGSGNPVPVSATEPMPIIAGTGVTLPVTADVTEIGGASLTLGQKTMASSLPVVIASDQAAIPVTGTLSATTQDNVAVASGTISAIGQTSAWLTTGYAMMGFTLSGQWSGTMQILGSDDGTNWLIAVPLRESASSDVKNVATSAGHYTIRPVTKYVSISTTQITGSCAFIVTGKFNDGPEAGAELLAQSFHEDTGVKLQVNISGGLMKDEKGALILSDTKTFVIPGSANNSAGGHLIIDTTGYMSLQTHTPSAAGVLACSNDGLNWTSNTGMFGVRIDNAGNAAQTGMSIGALTVWPIVSKYIRVLMTSVGTQNSTLVLRNIPYTTSILGPTWTNLSHILGNPTMTAGVNGLQAIGGSANPGATPQGAPVAVAGWDGSFIRRPLTDTSGRQIVNINALPIPATQSNQNVTLLPIIDQSEHMDTGMSKMQMLYAILIEMRIMNSYLFQLPGMLQTPTGMPDSDEPGIIRNNPADLD